MPRRKYLSLGGQEKIVKVGEGDVVWGYYYFVE